jgi:hypothetical protein
MIFQEMGRRGMHWIDVPQDKDRLQALVIAVMMLQVPENVGHFLTG